MTQNTLNIPAELVPEFEAWGKLTAQLFGKLRAKAGIVPGGVPTSQAWYWSRQWQDWERQADEDIRAGRVKGFDTMDELISSLNL